MGEISLHAAYELMRQAVSSGEHEKVAGIALHVLQYFPQNLKAKLYLGEAYIAAQKLDEAHAMLSEVCECDPENIVAQVGLSAIAERRGELLMATQHLEQAIEMRPDMADLRTRLVNLYRRSARSDVYLQLSRVGLARLFVRGRMFDQAIDEFEQLVDTHPQRRDIKIALAEALWRNGDERKAYELCQQLLRDYPTTLKANLIVAQYTTGRDEEQSEAHWDNAEAFDPLHETAIELFGADTIPTVGEWVLPAWDDVAWYQHHLQQQTGTGIRMRYLSAEVTPVIDDASVEAVLDEMRSAEHVGDHDHSADCVCMDIEEPAHDSTGMLLQRTLDRQAELQQSGQINHSSAVQPPLTSGSVSLQTVELDPADAPADPVRKAGDDVSMSEFWRDDRSTTPVEPAVDEVTTEPVQLQPKAPVLPFKVDNADEDDYFLASVLASGQTQANANGAPTTVDADTAVASGNELSAVLRIDTTMLRTLTSSDDLYAMLAKIEIQQAPSPTEDLRDVVARTLGGGVVERPKAHPVYDERLARQAAKAAGVTLESLLEHREDQHPPATTGQGDDLLANLLAQPDSGLTEGMRGLSAALPRVDRETLAKSQQSDTRDYDESNNQTLTTLLTEDMAAVASKRKKDDSVAKSDTPVDVDLQMMLETPMGVADDNDAEAPVASVLDSLAVSQGMRLHDFPEMPTASAVNGEDVLRALGVSTGEMTQVNTGMLSDATPVSKPNTPVMNQVPSQSQSAQTTRAGTLEALIPTPAASKGDAVSGNEAIDGYLRALQADPENMVLRLSVARVAMQCRMYETAVTQYKHLIRGSALLEDVVHDLRDLIGEVNEAYMRRECSRLLGNAYARQGRVQEAVEAYRMTHNSGSPVFDA